MDINNLNKLVDQQNFLARRNFSNIQEENIQNNSIPFLSKNISILGLKIPYWMIICCVIVIILLVLFMIPDYTTSQPQIIKPDYDIMVTSESPINTVIDKILKPYYDH